MGYFASQFFDGYRLQSKVVFTVENGRIASVTPDAEPGQHDVLDGLIMPAMVDVQVNGGGGVQFNEAPVADSLLQMSRAYLTTGTGSIMPTLITDDIAVMSAGADAIAEAHKADPAAIPGVHFEGPHLSAAKKGMHSAAHIRPLSDDEFALFTRLVEAGVIVSAGHTNADADTCFRAFDAGATGATHLYNAMSALTSREPGVVGSALYRDDVYCGLIVDHQHVHPVSATLAIRLKGDDKLMLVTDAMAPAASDADHFMYQGIKVLRQGPTLKLADGTLAGSVLTMEEAIQHTRFDLDIALESTLKMATSTPANFLGLSSSIGTLQTGSQANWIAVNDALQVQRVWRNGVCMS